VGVPLLLLFEFELLDPPPQPIANASGAHKHEIKTPRTPSVLANSIGADPFR